MNESTEEIVPDESLEAKANLGRGYMVTSLSAPPCHISPAIATPMGMSGYARQNIIFTTAAYTTRTPGRNIITDKASSVRMYASLSHALSM